MKSQTRNKGIAAIFAAALVGTLFIGGIGGYALAKAEGSGQTSVALRASRWDHEERAALDSSNTVLIPRSAREDDGSTNRVNSFVLRTMREGPERADGTR
jgi:hypothetical protein